MEVSPLKVAVIGGGAAGFFAAITAKEKHPHSEVTIFEKASQPLAKVKITGGGRCNLTHAAKSVADLCKGYPRGGNSLKKIFHRFDHLLPCNGLNSMDCNLLPSPTIVFFLLRKMPCRW